MALFRRHTRQGTATTPDTGTERTRQVTVASATLVGRTQIRRATSGADWRDEIWGYFDTVGELRYSARWLPNAASRCTLFIGQTPDSSSEPVPAEVEEFPEAAPARQVLEDLHYGQVGQAEMLRRMAIHLSVPGETYLVGLDPQPDQGITERRWYVVSIDEIKVSNRGETRLTLPDTGQTVTITPTTPPSSGSGSPTPARAGNPTRPCAPPSPPYARSRAYPTTSPPPWTPAWPGPGAWPCRTPPPHPPPPQPPPAPRGPCTRTLSPAP